MSKVKDNIQILRRSMHIMFSIERQYALLLVFTNMLSSVFPYINIYMAARIINVISNSSNKTTLISLAIFTVVINSALILISAAMKHFLNYHLEQFFKNEKMLFSQKCMEMKYSQLEKQETLQLREQIYIESQTGYNMYYLCTFLGKLVQGLTNILLSFGLTIGLFLNGTIPWAWKMVIIINMIVVIFVGYITTRKINMITENMFSGFVSYNLKYNFYNDYLKNYHTGKDIRMYHMESVISDQQKELDWQTYEIERKAKKRIVINNFFNNTTTDILKICAYLIATLACLKQALPIGDITQYVTCMALFVTSISGIINDTQALFYNNRYLNRYLEFFDLPSQMKSETSNSSLDEKKFELIFDHVSFKYPESNEFVLRDINFKIQSGENLAIVGKNGSGKTTFIKLLCRLYDPTEGKITFNGIDIRDLDHASYLKMLGIVFQDFKLFSLQLAQNIACNQSYDADKIIKTFQQLGLKKFTEQLPNGIETPIYKDYDEDGIEISGGEAQKIAIARSLYKNAKLFILDEPTSALDPISEADIYIRLHNIIGDKTAIYISHRLSSCKFCEKIAVFDDGQIVQHDSHEKLIADKNGKYYELWQAQAQYYNEEV